jgi:hypothetical protein
VDKTALEIEASEKYSGLLGSGSNKYISIQRIDRTASTSGQHV